MAAILPMHVYEYRAHIGKTESKKKANLDLEVLSHMFTKAIEWGVVHHHPMSHKKVTKFSLKPRKVRVNPDDLIAFASTLTIVTEILNLPGYTRSSYLFHTRDDEPYIKADGTTSGFDSIWQRHMVKAIKEGKVSTRFTEHDLRKIRASTLTLEQAQHLLRHTTPE